MLLALDIGNSEITIGLYREAGLQSSWRLTTNPDRTPDEWAQALNGFLLHAGHSPNEVRTVIVASVAPQVTGSLVAGIARSTGCDATMIEPTTKLPVTLDVDDPLSVGADRIVNALAVLDLVKGDAIVVDFGTATTFDCVLGDGRFIGGAIMPGLRTSADQLTTRAAKLPATDLLPPTRAIGRRTEDCIRAGVLYGAADAVDGMVRRVKAEWPGKDTPVVVATGGLAATVAPFSSTIEQVEPDLTLRGLAVAARALGLAW